MCAASGVTVTGQDKEEWSRPNLHACIRCRDRMNFGKWCRTPAVAAPGGTETERADLGCLLVSSAKETSEERRKCRTGLGAQTRNGTLGPAMNPENEQVGARDAEPDSKTRPVRDTDGSRARGTDDARDGITGGKGRAEQDGFCPRNESARNELLRMWGTWESERVVGLEAVFLRLVAARLALREVEYIGYRRSRRNFRISIRSFWFLSSRAKTTPQWIGSRTGMDAESEWMELFQPAAGKEGDRHSRYSFLFAFSFLVLRNTKITKARIGKTARQAHQGSRKKIPLSNLLPCFRRGRRLCCQELSPSPAKTKEASESNSTTKKGRDAKRHWASTADQPTTCRQVQRASALANIEGSALGGLARPNIYCVRGKELRGREKGVRYYAPRTIWNFANARQASREELAGEGVLCWAKMDAPRTADEQGVGEAERQAATSKGCGAALRAFSNALVKLTPSRALARYAPRSQRRNVPRKGRVKIVEVQEHERTREGKMK
ncbi:hypothetical protein B0H14DRAFT_3126932 [Mycena olivaceomarginata]|nr:hypothetical protein B0H14DRAFT_3126932 [Mycena olivaceomarginata]